MIRPDPEPDNRIEEKKILVSEVFSAIQGEAAFVGHRQVFLRLTGCNIRCSYCDQPEALEKKAGPCRLERTPGRRDWAHEPSPLPIETVASAVDKLWTAMPHHSVSVTGGEPLMQSRRLAQLLPLLTDRGHRVMLETNGTLPAALERVIEWVSDVSMDVKLSSVDGENVAAPIQQAFLEVARQRHVFVKIVVGPSTSSSELHRAVDMVHALDQEIEVFLQPVTPFGAVETSPSPAQVLAWQEQALARHTNVRVVPQTHKMLGQL
ncbi:MAG: 7-carboxy-7-deazaguanine synthase QueE [Acidimicrobiales bacterium]